MNVPLLTEEAAAKVIYVEFPPPSIEALLEQLSPVAIQIVHSCDAFKATLLPCCNDND